MHIPGYSDVEWLDLGAQADIYRARNAHGEIVALKLVRADRLVDEHDVMQRLEREARLLQQIRSDHVVGIRSFLRDLAGAWCLIEMDYLDGEPLHRVMNRLAGRTDPRVTRDSPTVKVTASAGGIALAPTPSPAEPFTRATRQVPANLQTADHVAWAVTRMLGICRGVAELHERRLVHRDLKPHNVMLVGNREVLIDFGLARSPDVTMMTKTGTAVGTVAYMSPQQLDGQVAIESDDVYGLGCTFFHLLTGWPPVDDGVKSLAKVAKRRRPPDVRRRNPAVPRALADIVARCLEPDRRDRCGDAGELLEALTAYCAGKPLPTRWSAGRFWRHQRDRLMVVAGASALSLFLAFLMFRSTTDGTARDVVARAERDPSAARARLQSLPDHERGAVLMAINRLVSADSLASTRVATALDFGMLKFEARSGYRLAISTANEGSVPATVRYHEFLSAEQPRYLIAPKGLAWVLIGSTDPMHWWSSNDPRVLHTLQAMEADGAGDPRSLACLPLDKPAPGSLVDMATAPAAAAGSSALRVDRREADGRLANYHRMWLRDRFRHGDVDQRLLRHPAEPAAATTMLEALCKQGPPLPEEMPASLSFWEAHRLALFLGCRLPSVNEWFAVASDGVEFKVGSDETRVKELAPAMGDPGDDLNACGVCFANTNAAEWTLNAAGSGMARFRAMPPITTFQGVKYFLTKRPVGETGGREAREATGLRLYRTRLQP